MRGRAHWCALRCVAQPLAAACELVAVHDTAGLLPAASRDAWGGGVTQAFAAAPGSQHNVARMRNAAFRNCGVSEPRGSATLRRSVALPGHVSSVSDAGPAGLCVAP